MTKEIHLSRRKTLALGLGSVGAVTVGNAFLSTAAGRVDYTYQTLQVNGEVDLILDWSEFYNGEQLESQETPTDHDSGNPLLTLENVHPGDRGRLAFGLQTASEQPANLEFLFRMIDESENGLTEPETSATDTTPNSGELPQYVTVRGWYDGGVDLGGSTIYGACNGRFDEVGEDQKFEGSLAGVVSDQWRPLDAQPANEDSACLGPNEGLCFAIEWVLPEDIQGVDDNVIQGDSVSLEIGFRGAACSGG